MKNLIAFMPLFLLLAVVGCSKKYQYPADYVGTWKSSQAELTLNSDSTYVLNNPGVGQTNGIFRTGPNTLIFFDKSGVCTDSAAGNYDWRYRVESVTGTFYQNLTLSLLEDTCGTRASLMAGKYRKQ